MEYCEKYGGNLEKVCEEQCNVRKLNGSSTAKIIHEAMLKSSASLDKLDERRKWRDERLAALAVHQANFTET